MTKRILKTTIVVGTIILTLSLIMRFHPWLLWTAVWTQVAGGITLNSSANIRESHIN